jgi:hypothetical protein
MSITGEVRKSITRDGVTVTEFAIPAVAKTVAKRKARVNARVKGLDNPRVGEPQLEGQGSIPGQKMYVVEVTSNR